MADALAEVPDTTAKLLLWERAQGDSLQAALARFRGDAIAVLVGPEGGFTDAELTRATLAGFAPIRFGPRILRAETAAIAAAAALHFALGK
jgi:16S rRNA (uracil1498-N3)-methyltransferase